MCKRIKEGFETGNHCSAYGEQPLKSSQNVAFGDKRIVAFGELSAFGDSILEKKQRFSRSFLPYPPPQIHFRYLSLPHPKPLRLANVWVFAQSPTPHLSFPSCNVRAFFPRSLRSPSYFRGVTNVLKRRNKSNRV